MKWIKLKKREKEEMAADSIEDPILKALYRNAEISRETAKNIPAVSACVDAISDSIASMQIKLYRKKDGLVEEITDDPRTNMLNADTGDTLDGTQLKKALIEDMYLAKGGYAYVNKVGGEVKSIHYVKSESVSFVCNTDPIFKDYKVYVNGKGYEGYEFIKLLRNTRDGFRSKSIIEESPQLLEISYAAQRYEENLVKSGGNKKGFLQSTKRLTGEAMANLKAAFRNLYSNNTENVIVLNEGLSFKESSNTSVEMQLHENKEINNDSICKIFLVPPPIINGGAKEEDKKLYHENCIYPILMKFCAALNAVLLREDEKKEKFFLFDDSDFMKADIEKRYAAYEKAIKNGWMQRDEVREMEKMPKYDLDFITLGLQDVLYWPKTGKIYTPNTDKVSDGNELKTNEVKNGNNNQE